MKPLFPLLAVLLAFAPGCGDDGEVDAGSGEATQYSAELRPLNDSGVTGEAVFDLDEDAIRVRITASGLEQDQIISPIVKGLTGTSRARCPDGGNVSAREGRRAYGRPLFQVQPFPTMKPGQDALRYDLRLSLSEAERRRLEPLEGRALVLQGKTADREGNVSAGRAWNLPLACGRISTSD